MTTQTKKQESAKDTEHRTLILQKNFYYQNIKKCIIFYETKIRKGDAVEFEVPFKLRLRITDSKKKNVPNFQLRVE